MIYDKNYKVKVSKMNLASNYFEACKNFFSYLIENEIIETDEDVLNILLQNNLRESLGKYKLDIMSNVCKTVIKSGSRQGQECGKSLKDGERYCKLHSKAKTERVDKEEDEDDTVYIIRKNEHNNFVYGNTGLIFKSSLEKYIVAREGSKGEWLPLDEYDIEECKKLGLRWKKIQNKIKGETTNLEVLKKYELFPRLNENDKHNYRLIDVDEDNENNEN